jgi:hypothetical protein
VLEVVDGGRREAARFRGGYELGVVLLLALPPMELELLEPPLVSELEEVLGLEAELVLEEPVE